MTKKKNTKMKGVRATLPAPAAAEAAEATPLTDAAPEPAAVMMDPVGMRTPSVWSPRDRNPRPVGELTRTATLIRGYPGRSRIAPDRSFFSTARRF